jgi:serine/threonine protein kinase
MTQPHDPPGVTTGTCRFLRAVAVPLLLPIPTFLRPIDGWNVRIRGPDAIDLFFVTQAMRPAIEFQLTSTDKQIICYGLARGLAASTPMGLFHEDLRITDILLDERRYPVIARAGEPAQVPSIATVRTLPLPAAIHLCPSRVRAGLKPKRPVLAIADEWSLAMIMYQLVEAQPVDLPLQPGESCFDGLSRGARPRIGPNTAKWEGLLSELWREKDAPFGFEKIVQYLENPTNWLDGVDSLAFWRYKAYLDYEILKFKPKQLSFLTIQKLYQRQYADSFIRLGNDSRIQQFAHLVAWLTGRDLKGTNAQSYEPILRSLQEKGTLDAGILEAIEPRPPLPTFFRTCAGVPRKRVIVGDDCDGWEIVRFLREVVAASLGHPALLSADGWNVCVDGPQLALCLYSRTVAESPALTDITSKIIVVYGIARGLQFLHSLGLAHGNLCPSAVLIKDGYPLLTDIGAAADPHSRYAAPEVRDGGVPSVLSDAYSYAILAKEILKGSDCTEVEAFLASLEADRPFGRPLFDIIVSWLEANLPPGVIGERFEAYRGFLDVRAAAGDGVASPTWLIGLSRRLPTGSAIAATAAALSAATGDSDLFASVTAALRDRGSLTGFVSPIAPRLAPQDALLAPLLSFVVPRDCLVVDTDRKSVV